MAIQRAAGQKANPTKAGSGSGNPNGGGIVAQSFPMRSARRKGRQEITEQLKDERGDFYLPKCSPIP